MKKMLILIAVLALAGITFAAGPYYKAAPLSAAVTNTVTFTAIANRVTEPMLFVRTTTQTNTPVITVNPYKSGAPDYTVYTGATKTNTTTTVVLNDYSDSTSAKVVLLPGDILTITGTAESWAATGYYILIKETPQ